jgi:NCS1 family nucleobase:cation symporter-1
MIPWSAINLVDFYIVRRGHYAVEEFFQAGGGRYGNWNVRAIVIYLVGFAAEIPFVSTSKFTGFLNHALGGVDIAWALGFIVCGAAYYAVASRSTGKEVRLSALER